MVRKRRLRHVVLTSGTFLVIFTAAVVSGALLRGGRAARQPQAEAGRAGLHHELSGDRDAGGEAASGQDRTGGSGDVHGTHNQARDGAASDSDLSASTAPAPGRKTTLSYGPFVLPPAPPGSPAVGRHGGGTGTGTPDAGRPGGGVPVGEVHLNLLLNDVPKPCSDCFLTSLRPDLVYPDGRSANLDTGVMLHHAVWFQAGQPDVTCGPATVVGRVGQRFFASGNERTGGAFVPGFGYYLDGSSWTLLVELMNHTSSLKTVSLTLEATWLPNTPDMRPVTPIWLDVDNCRDSQYSAPAGPSRTHWRWTSTRTGRVISAAGHLHDGGVKAVLANLTSGQTLCTSVAGYGRNPAYRGSIESMSTCNWDAIGTVRAGEVLALDSYYHLFAPRDDVMGIMLAYLYETPELSGGRPPPSQTEPEPAPSPGPHRH